MSQTIVSIRMDNALKNQFTQICEELGLSASAAINVFVKATVRNRGIPFALTVNEPNTDAVCSAKDPLKDEKVNGLLRKTKDAFDDLDL